MDPIGTAIKVGTSFLPLLGKRAIQKQQLRRIEQHAQSVVVSNSPARFFEYLTPKQLLALDEALQSFEFRQLMLQTMVASLRGFKTDDASALREQVRAHMKRLDVFEGVDVVEATDVISTLLQSSAQAVLATATRNHTHPQAVAMATDVAVMAARGGSVANALGDLAGVVRKNQLLRGQVKTTHSKLRLPTIVSKRTVRWSQLYVRPNFRPWKPGADEDALDLQALLDTQLRFVVLGDPGAGKSTLAQHLAYEVASDRYESLRGLTPIVFPVRSQAQGIRAGESRLLDYLSHSVQVPYGVEMTTDQLEYSLLNGRVIVIIDGLDELGESHYRQDFVHVVEAFARMYPLARIMVTSRENGYDQAPLDRQIFPAVVISSFSEDQVRRYTTNWFKLEDSANKVSDFIEQSAHVPDLRSNPLVLSLLCTLFLSDLHIPTNRPEIYTRCADLLFDRWDADRGLKFAPHLRPFMKRVTHRLAWRMFTDSKGRLAIPRRELSRFLEEDVLADLYASPDEAGYAAEDFLDFCAGRAWVLTDVGANAVEPMYGFTHKTFLEFFAASHLVKLDPSPTSVWNKLRDRLEDSGWEVVAELAVQILDRDRDDGFDDVLTLILDGEELSPEQPTASRPKLLFAARCLESSFPGTRNIRRLCRLAVESSLRLERRHRVDVRWTAWQLADALLQQLLAVTTRGNVERVGAAVSEALQDALNDVDLQDDAAMLIVACARQPELPVARLVTERCFVPGNAAIARWDRLDRVPEPEDVEYLGPLSLLAGFAALGVRVGGRLAGIISRALGCAGDEIEMMDAQLSSLYPALASMELRPEGSDLYVGDSSLGVSVTGESNPLTGYSPEARGALALGLIRLAGTAPVAVEARAVSEVLSARHERFRRDEAIASINRWELPEVAHSQLVHWVMGQPLP